MQYRFVIEDGLVEHPESGHRDEDVDREPDGLDAETEVHALGAELEFFAEGLQLLRSRVWRQMGRSVTGLTKIFVHFNEFDLRNEYEILKLKFTDFEEIKTTSSNLNKWIKI